MAHTQLPDASDAQRPDIQLPEGYTDESEFLTEMRMLFTDDVNADQNNRLAGIEDLRFLIGDQWDDMVRQRRELARKPVLTINRLPAFLAQVVGSRRLNETDIKVLPDNGGTKAIAKVREGLMRNIQKQSYAEQAYDQALTQAVACGIGAFKVVLDYDSDEVFEQSIRIEPILDPMATVWDRTITDPTGRDAGHGFEVEAMPREAFNAKWPWATPADVMVDSALRGDLRMNGWITATDVRVVNYWTLRTRLRTLALMVDGKVLDVTDLLDEKADKYDTTVAATTLANIAQHDNGAPIMREVNRKYAQMYVCSGTDVLEGPYDLPISRIPLYRVPGWEITIGESRHRWGLIRFLKDPQRLHNYWRAVIAEKLQQTPRATWMAADTAIAGREPAWRNSHLSDDTLLIWNANSGQKPERVPPSIVEDALLGQAQISEQDIKDVSNIHEANLGMPSNEVSGAAILARQRVSDTGTILYHDNLSKAIEQAGVTINELMPVVYDTPRIVRVIGEDDEITMQAINHVGNNESVDIGDGRYSVTVKTGPSYATKRIEAAANMMNLAQAMPEVLQLSADLIVEAQDWPKAGEIARRIRMTLPPGILSQRDLAASPELQQKAAAGAQQSAEQQKILIQQTILEFMKTKSEIELNAARAHHFQQQADSIAPHMQNESVNTASQAAERELKGSLEAVKTAAGG